MVLDRADVFDPTLEVACRSLQWWSGERVTVNIYLTTNAADGFELHWDDHDVLVVQLSGEKDWEVRGPSRAVPLHRDAARNDTPGEETLWAGTVRPGDVLHIPRGYWHRAGRDGRGSGHSLHMTFGFTTRTGASWLSWLADRSREHELFRHDLAPTPGSEQHRRLVDAAVELVGSAPPANFLAARARRRPVPARALPADVRTRGLRHLRLRVPSPDPRTGRDGRGALLGQEAHVQGQGPARPAPPAERPAGAAGPGSRRGGTRCILWPRS